MEIKVVELKLNSKLSQETKIKDYPLEFVYLVATIKIFTFVIRILMKFFLLLLLGVLGQSKP